MTVTLDDTNLKAIADAIRAKNGTEETYKPSEMAEAIGGVYSAGKNAEWSDFWDSCQQNGARTDYQYAFACWQQKQFKPKYAITPTNGYYAFFNLFAGEDAVSLTQILKDVGLDTSNCAKFDYMFSDANVTELPIINATSTTGFSNVFRSSSSLVTIEKLILKSNGSQTMNSTFTGCTSLANIVIEGVIGYNVDMRDCPLTKDSLTSVVNALSASASGKTIYLNKIAKEEAFTDEEWSALTADKTNWTISLA